MAYKVDRFNGTFLVSVEDGTIDTTTDLRFLGKNYAGYGEVQNENFLHLMENFANTSPPPKAIAGQLWYDSGNKKLKFYDGNRFRTTSGSETGNEAPAGLQVGEFWFDTVNQQIRVWSGTEFVLVGPETPPDAGAQAISYVPVQDNLPVPINHFIVKVQSGGDIIAIISKDEFVLGSANPITGFNRIKKGVTLVNTNDTTGVTSSDHYFWGTSSNTLRLGGFDASEFVRSGNISFNERVRFLDQGFTVGDSNDFRVEIVNGNEPIFESRLGQPITFRIRVSDSDVRNPLTLTTTACLPGLTDFYSLGSPSNKWLNVYSTTFTGNIVGNLTGNSVGIHRGNLIANDESTAYNADTKTFTGLFNGTLNGNVIGNITGTTSNALTLNGLSATTAATPNSITQRDSSANITANRFIGLADTANRIFVDVDNSVSDSAWNPTVNTTKYRTAKTNAVAYSVAARDSSGNLTATVFNGTATSARYADLAEKYLTDKEYDVGTVVTVGGDSEVRASVFGDRAIGVVSENPAYMMNSELEGGTYIALKGRVPVKVVGAVKKGDRLIATDNGYAICASSHQFSDVFAIALESNNDSDVKIIESVIL
jgi:hypothetical protein